MNAVVTYLQRQIDALDQTEPKAREGDVEAIHDMRVAVRRLRSTSRTFRGLWDRRVVDRIRSELKWFGDRLGRVRDAQVMAARLDEGLRAEPPEVVLGPVAARMQQRFAAEGAEARAGLEKALDSQRYRALRTALNGLAADAGRAKDKWVVKRVRHDLERADQRLDAALDRPSDDPRRDPELHAARRAYKRARYAAEVRGSRTKKLVKRLKELQDLLGTHQDAVITRTVLRQQAVRAYRDRDNTFTYGLLYGRQLMAADDAERELPAAVREARRRKLRQKL